MGSNEPKVCLVMIPVGTATIDMAWEDTAFISIRFFIVTNYLKIQCLKKSDFYISWFCDQAVGGVSPQVFSGLILEAAINQRICWADRCWQLLYLLSPLCDLVSATWLPAALTRKSQNSIPRGSEWKLWGLLRHKLQASHNIISTWEV